MGILVQVTIINYEIRNQNKQTYTIKLTILKTKLYPTLCYIIYNFKLIKYIT